MRRRPVPTAAVVLLALAAIPAPGAAQGDGPTIRGLLAQPVPEAAGRAAVELFPLLDPHARALVELGEAPATAAVAKAQVRTDGSFTLSAPGPGPWRLRIEIPGHPPQERVVPPAFDFVEIEPVPLVPADEASAAGAATPTADGPAAPPRRLELRDAAGRPVAGAVVGIDPGPEDPRTPPRPTGVTDAEGRVQAALPAGAESVWIETGRGWAVSLPLPPGCGTDEAPCTLGLPAPLELAGEVRDAVSYRPQGGALVWSVNHPDRAVTADGRGRFVLRFAPGSMPNRFGAAAAGYVGSVTWRHPDGRSELPLALQPAMWVAGRVVDADGAPLAGVRLRLRQSREPWTTTKPSPEIETESGGDGGFRFPGVAAERGRWLRAELPGFAPAAMEAPPGAAEDLEVVLAPGGAVVGWLVDPGGGPVPGARVRVSRWRSGLSAAVDGATEAAAESTSGADGGFALRHLAAGGYTLVVNHPAHKYQRLPPVELAAGETVDLGEVELAPGAPLSGRVVDSDGRPVAGAWASAWAEGRTFAPLPTSSRNPVQTGEDGSFELPGLPVDEPLRLVVTHQDHLRKEIDGVVLPLDEPLVVELRRGSRVFGRVLGPRSEPIVGAIVGASVEVRVAGGRRPAGFGHATTSADGGFEIGGLSAGILRLVAEADGYPSGEVAGLEIGDDGDVGPVEIRLEAGAEVSGRVLTSDGFPAAGASVTVRADSTPEAPSRYFSAGDLTDDRGEFGIEGTPLGPATIRAEHDRLGDGAAELLVQPGTNAVTLILEQRGRIHGRVVDGDGAPVAGARVELGKPGSVASPRETRTDVEGRFVFHWMEEGDYRLAAAAPGLRLDGPPVPVTLGDGPAPAVELVLTPGEEILGRLLGLPEGADPEGYSIVAYRTDDPGFEISRRIAVADAGGGFRLTGLGPGRWTVSARGRSGRSAGGEVEVVAGGGPYRIDLDLGGGLTLTGSVRVGGEPLEGASVHLLRAGGREHRATVTTAADGGFRVEGLEPGGYQVSVAAGAVTLDRRELVLEADGQLHFDLAAASLTGRVLDAGGAPVAHARVLASPTGGEEAGLGFGFDLTDSAGGFAFPLLAPGDYEVIAAEGGRSARATVSLAAGDHLELELRLEPDAEPVD